MPQTEDDIVEREQRAIYVIMVLAVAPVLIALAWRGGFVDAGSTLCLLLAAAAIVGIAGGLAWRRDHGAPRARIHRR